MLNLNTHEFVAAFKLASFEDRVSALEDILRQSADQLGSILSIAAARHIDPPAFQQATKKVLSENQNNLPALRALTWHYIRNADYQLAQEYLVQAVKQWPKMADFRLELLRTVMLYSSNLDTSIIDLGKAALVNPLMAASYNCQLGLCCSELSKTGQIDAFKKQLEASIGPVFNTFFDHRSFALKTQDVMWDVCKTLLKAGSVALVGNGGSLRGKSLGPLIDEHDVIVRCNFPTIKNFRADVGERTDIVFFNEAIISNLRMFIDRDPIYRNIPLVSMHPEELNLRDIPLEAEERIGRISAPMRSIIRCVAYNRPTTGLMAMIFLAIILKRKVTLFGWDVDSSNLDAQ